MKAFWNERYANKEYAYGIKPNEFYKDQLSQIPKGKILFPAEGEGRNAVYAALQGFEVFAFDMSEEGKQKTGQLAFENKVTIDYEVASVDEITYPQDYFDTIVFVFVHFPLNARNQYYQKLLSYLKPNGAIIFEAFGKAQIHLNSGGPKQEDMLFSEDEIKNDFKNIDFITIETADINLDEGVFHQGKANVVRFLGTKK
ncbi:class I SAM-dependent methyltransferase [Flavobacterium piscis]|uniref:2-polyprenyl-3-methyl-5-hydroxy-6-metoxy-1, 4-benzoquinol methylase n=1 Tax=Flavobacterium piscis TaxID=1114874 RepID=A0ABU1Y7P5_9FLAO|nr:class I SAM-dependent methyltransferase [Flavobacterium piscis]MDR7210252.1 2-polyprenyl-3-methyl-5-hydroxy-6-metoxy-1,4-benzoquinol methylase [Flavobacterium piscis]